MLSKVPWFNLVHLIKFLSVGFHPSLVRGGVVLKWVSKETIMNLMKNLKSSCQSIAKMQPSAEFRMEESNLQPDDVELAGSDSLKMEKDLTL